MREETKSLGGGGMEGQHVREGWGAESTGPGVWTWETGVQK